LAIAIADWRLQIADWPIADWPIADWPIGD